MLSLPLSESLYLPPSLGLHLSTTNWSLKKKKEKQYHQKWRPSHRNFGWITLIRPPWGKIYFWSGIRQVTLEQLCSLAGFFIWAIFQSCINKEQWLLIFKWPTELHEWCPPTHYYYTYILSMDTDANAYVSWSKFSTAIYQEVSTKLDLGAGPNSAKAVYFPRKILFTIEGVYRLNLLNA